MFFLLYVVACMLLVVCCWLLVDGRRPCRPCRPCCWLLLLFFTCFDQLKASKSSDAGVREVLSHPVRPQRDLYQLNILLLPLLPINDDSLENETVSLVFQSYC